MTVTRVSETGAGTGREEAYLELGATEETDMNQQRKSGIGRKEVKDLKLYCKVGGKVIF